jgi:hypothetical protein
MKHGSGMWTKGKPGSLSVYEGDYVKDKKKGQGKFIWASGNLYSGSYDNDERNGFGVMNWVDGSEYRGQWVNGVQHGKGEMSYADGTVKKGLFENNVFIEEIIDEEMHEDESSIVVDN